jgi:hypothetical protein
MGMIAPPEKKTFDQFGHAGLFLSGELAAKREGLLAQKQMNALCVHAHKLAFVGFKSRGKCGREKLKRYLNSGGWAE